MTNGFVHGTDIVAIASITGYDKKDVMLFRNSDCKAEVLLDTLRKGIAEATTIKIGFVRLHEALTYSTERSAFQADAEYPCFFMTNNDIRRNCSEGFVHSFPRMLNALQPSRAWGVDREIYAMLMTRLSTRGFNSNVREESLPFRLSRAKPQAVLGALATKDIEEIARIEPGLEDFLIHYPIVTPINTTNVAPIFADVLGTTLQTWTSSNERCGLSRKISDLCASRHGVGF